MNDNVVNIENTAPTRWDTVKAWVIGLTGVLLVLPALINSGIDIYKALLNIPSTESEAINTQLFQDHFQETPVTVVPVSIKTDNGNVVMQMSIYENGDIYAEYGFHSQWFPMPGKKQAVAHSVLPLVSVSYAADRQHMANQSNARSSFVQQDVIQNNQINRSRYYSNGQLETFSINIQTGAIKNKQFRQIGKTPQASPSAPIKQKPNFQSIEVDLVNLKKQKSLR